MKATQKVEVKNTPRGAIQPLDNVGLEAVPLNWTGERMVPVASDQNTFLEHVYRYKSALPFT